MTVAGTPNKHEDLLAKSLIAGICCAVVSAILNPMDVTKIRMQTHQPEPRPYRSMLQGMTKIIREERVFGLFKGLEPSVIREASPLNHNTLPLKQL